MNNKNIKVVDEHSIDRNANVIFGFNLDENDYVVYWIERDEENSNIFVSRVIKNIDGTFNMLDIDDFMEKSKLSDVVKNLITMAVNDEADKLDGMSVTLSDGKVVNFINVSFNKEQRINVQKTYITTVKKEVVRVTEKYYDVKFVVEQPNIFEDIFPTVSSSNLETNKEVKVEEPEINWLSKESSSELIIKNMINNPFESESVVVEPIEEKVSNGGFINVGTESSILEDIPQVIPTVTPVISQVADVVTPVVEVPAPSVIEPITIAEPAINVVEQAPILPIEPTPIVASVSEVSEKVEVSENNDVKPLVFNAAKETNLNAALGEVANSASIPVENITPVREFGVEPVTSMPVQDESSASTSNSTPVVDGKKAGFANNKFFIIVAVAFFLAACAFLGYEVFNYFQLTK